MPQQLHPPADKIFQPLIELAWQEDYRGCDMTSETTISADLKGCYALVYREDGVVAGMPVVQQVMARYDSRLELEVLVGDGLSIQAGQTAAVIRGPVRSILAAERVALNFLQRLSGIATLTQRYVQAAAGTLMQICDTRKTTPGWRDLEKYAVRCGGGHNHRQGLYDAALIKDNHLASLNAPDLVTGLKLAISRLSKYKPRFIQVEVDTLEQFEQVLTVSDIDMVLLDNMTDMQMARAVALRDEAGLKGRLLLEASGGITLERIPALGKLQIDRVSIGALTHSVRNLDIGLDAR